MKPLYLILISAVISLEIVAQIPGGGNYYSQLMQPKEFKTWPVPDSLVQNDVNGQLVGYIPYDFYSANQEERLQSRFRKTNRIG